MYNLIVLLPCAISQSGNPVVLCRDYRNPLSALCILIHMLIAYIFSMTLSFISTVLLLPRSIILKCRNYFQYYSVILKAKCPPMCS